MAGGRPTKMTTETIGKLESAFLLGCTDREACLFADIHPDTLYKYCKDNPEFSDRKELLKEDPVFKARQSVIDNMKNDGNLALKFLERKKKDEFSVRQEHEHSGSINKETDEELDNRIKSLMGGLDADSD